MSLVLQRAQGRIRTISMADPVEVSMIFSVREQVGALNQVLGVFEVRSGSRSFKNPFETRKICKGSFQVLRAFPKILMRSENQITKIIW